MGAMLVLKILGVTAVIALIGAAGGIAAPRRRGFYFDADRPRRPFTIGHFVTTFLVSWIALSGIVIFIIVYLRR
jgi:hypothetical protein